MALEHYKMLDCTFPEVQEYLKTKKTIIIPYALSEQHGAHLPLDVDVRNAEFISRKMAEKLDCLIAPTLNYTFSGGMLPGTINVKPTTFCNLVGEIIDSLELGKQGVLDSTLPRANPPTLFSKYGNNIPLLMIFIVFILSILTSKKEKRYQNQ